MFNRGLLNIMTLAFLLGPSFVFNKIALVDIEPVTVVSLRIGFAAVLLALLLKCKNISFKVSKTFLIHAFILGFFANGFPFVCFCYSLFYIPTSLSALMNGMMPVFSILLARLFLQERLTANKIMGIVLGLFGFCILFVPSLLHKGKAFNPVGMSLSLIGAASYAVAAVYARKRVIGVNPLIMSLYQLASCLLYLLPLAFFLECPVQDLALASISTWGAVLGAALLGTGLAIIVYYRILLTQGVAAVSMVTYLLPIISTVLGVVFLKESLHSNFMIAATCILLGIILVNKKAKT